MLCILMHILLNYFCIYFTDMWGVFLWIAELYDVDLNRNCILSRSILFQSKFYNCSRKEIIEKALGTILKANPLWDSKLPLPTRKKSLRWPRTSRNAENCRRVASEYDFTKSCWQSTSPDLTSGDRQGYLKEKALR